MNTSKVAESWQKRDPEGKSLLNNFYFLPYSKIVVCGKVMVLCGALSKDGSESWLYQSVSQLGTPVIPALLSVGALILLFLFKYLIKLVSTST